MTAGSSVITQATVSQHFGSVTVTMIVATCLTNRIAVPTHLCEHRQQILKLETEVKKKSCNVYVFAYHSVLQFLSLGGIRIKLVLESWPKYDKPLQNS